MRKEETNDNVRLAAIKAMLNSLEFTKNNFQNDVSECFDEMNDDRFVVE